MCAFLRVSVSIHYIGKEIDEEYFKIAAERLKSDVPAPLLLNRHKLSIKRPT